MSSSAGAGAPVQQQQHRALRLLVQGDVVAVQPADTTTQHAAAGGAGSGVAMVPTLSVVLSSGRVSVAPAPKLSAGSSSSTPSSAASSSCREVLALVGLFSFRAGSVLAAVTEAEQVAVLRGQPVLRVTQTSLIKPPGATFDAGERRLLSYLSDALNPTGSGRNLFFGYDLDLTLNAQALSEVLSSPASASKAIADRADRRFFWNRVMAAPLLEAGGAPWVLPMIVGSVGQLADVPGVAGGKPVSLSIALIARRALDRAGTRHWRRGADAQGSVANFVETEQLVTLDGGRVVASYVQVRGSIPLLWTQLPNIKYKPPTALLEGPAGEAACDAHFSALLARYKAVSCINLVNQHGTEGRLASAFGAAASRYSRTVSAALTYTAFDFHKECGATNYGRLALLWGAIKPEYERFGQFVTGAATGNTRQRGVFRVNCVDCLDRTNVVQGLLARHALEDLFSQLGLTLLPADASSSSSSSSGAASLASGPLLPSEVEAAYKALWADHGDDVSRQYAGTGALKSGFTRTGKRGLGGLLDDGLKSVTRYYLNNFKDGHKQDAFDLISGAFKVKRDVKLQFRRQHSPAVPILLALMALGYALTAAHSLGHASSSSSGGGSQASSSQASRQQPRGGGGGNGSSDGDGSGGLLGAAATHVLAPLLLAGGLLLLVARHGRALVDRPQLCPALANTVAYVGGGSGSKGGAAADGPAAAAATK